MKYEHCCECDAHTGRAGRADDSLYAGDWGPYCEDCWGEVPEKLVALIDTLKAQLAAEREKVRMLEGLLIDLNTVWSKSRYNRSKKYGSPNHAHAIPGVWDSDNGALAGKPCAECAVYDRAREIVAAIQATAPGAGGGE